MSWNRHRLVGAAAIAAVVLGITVPAPARAEYATPDMSGMDHMSPAPATAAATPVAGPNQVIINNFAFGPTTLTVKAGTTVTWVNKDGDAHTVTGVGAKPLFGSQPLDTGDSFSFTFEKPGSYAYFCKIHPSMKGTVIVQ